MLSVCSAAAENERLAELKKASAAEQNRLLLENFALLEKRRQDREKKHDEDRCVAQSQTLDWIGLD